MKKLPEREEITVIHWRPVEERPEEGRYVLIQYIDDADDLACDWAAYENGKFAYAYDRRAWGEINERIILGWSYLPFDD